MPESIQNGGSGANHWEAKQAKLDEKVEAKEKAEEADEGIKAPAVLNDAEKMAGIKTEKEAKEAEAKKEGEKEE